jgi:hypothetical protein
VAAHRDLESENTKLEFNCKRLEMKLAIADERNRTMSKRLTQMVAERATNGVKPQSPQPKFRVFLDSMANNHAAELSQLKGTHESLVKQYRALESQYRDLQLSMEQERRETLARQRKMITPFMTEPGYPRLLDDSRSIDTRTSKVSSDPTSSIAPSEYALSVISETSRSDRDTIHESHASASNSQPQSPVQYRPLVSLSPTPDMQDPFTTALPRRPTKSDPTGPKGVKIKPNSEIRIYGRY